MPVRAPASSSFDWYRVNVRHAASVAPVNRKRAIIGHLHPCTEENTTKFSPSARSAYNHKALCWRAMYKLG
jgi:hypothetical protein